MRSSALLKDRSTPEPRPGLLLWIRGQTIMVVGFLPPGQVSKCPWAGPNPPYCPAGFGPVTVETNQEVFAEMLAPQLKPEPRQQLYGETMWGHAGPISLSRLGHGTVLIKGSEPNGVLNNLIWARFLRQG